MEEKFHALLFNLENEKSFIAKTAMVESYLKESASENCAEEFCKIIESGLFLHPINATAIATFSAKLNFGTENLAYLHDRVYHDEKISGKRFLDSCKLEKIVNENNIAEFNSRVDYFQKNRNPRSVIQPASAGQVAQSLYFMREQ